MVKTICKNHESHERNKLVSKKMKTVKGKFEKHDGTPSIINSLSTYYMPSSKDIKKNKILSNLPRSQFSEQNKHILMLHTEKWKRTIIIING